MSAHRIYFRKLLRPLAIVVTILFYLFAIISPIHAAAGINHVINFQGKVVNKTAGTNITNGNYDFIFKIYDSGSGGSLLWTEKFDSGHSNQLAVTDGIFRAGLGSVCSFSGGSCQGTTNTGVDFNSDGLFLDITFNGETMGSRVQLTAVPYAFNAEKVAGLTVTNNGGNTLNIAVNKTFEVDNSLTLSGADSKTINFGSNNLTFTTSGDATLILPTSGTVTALGNTTTGSGSTLVLASNPSFAGITLSSGGINLGGTVSDSSHCITGGATAAWGSCGSGGSGPDSALVIDGSIGVTRQINNTTDVLFGGTATASAQFSVLGLNNGTPTASVSATQGVNAGNGLTFSGSNATIQALRDSSLVIGGDTTGNITIAPRNGFGVVTFGTSTNGLTFDIANGGPILSGTARLTKTIILSPEYAGASLTADGSSNTNGSMTSDNTLNAGSVGWKNYYQWTSAQGTLQDYTVAVRVALPSDFDSWQTGSCGGSNCALEIAYQTGVSGTTDNAVSVQVNNAESTPGTVICTISAVSSTSWSTVGCTSTTLATSPTWNSAGSTAIIRIKIAADSTSSALARIGDITLRYYAKF